MVTIDLAEFDAHKRIMGHLENGPFILELPTVFSLVCLPNNTSIDQLNKAKVRGNNKYYGSLIGNLTNFYKLHIYPMFCNKIRIGKIGLNLFLIVSR